MQKMTTCLWFNGQAEEAMNYYTSIFKDSSKGSIMRNPAGVPGEEGAVLVASFTLNGSDFMALNGGPAFKFNESVSMVVNCDTQEEVNYYWEQLTANGGQESDCGWLKDRYGLSWQITPKILPQLLITGDAAKRERTMKAMMQMQKLDIAVLENA